MSYVSVFSRSILGISLLSCAFAYTVMSYKSIHMPHYLMLESFNEEQIKVFVSKQTIKPECGQLVLYNRNGSWNFGFIVKQCADGCYDIAALENHVVKLQVPLRCIKTLSTTWNNLFQPQISLDQMKKLLDERNNYYHVHGAPDGHGMILAPGSKIIVIGDLHGYFPSLQNHIMRLYRDGLIDEQFHLKPNCYLVALGDYTGDGGQNIAVFSTLLELQKNNPQQVFLLHGDHEDITKAQVNGFQKEWYGTFGDNQKNFCLSELVWLKVLMLFKSLPKVLFAGLQLPSTQHYEFLMFCHASCDFAWRPETLLNTVVEKHIDQLYKNPCFIEYRNIQENDASFSTGFFAEQSSERRYTSGKACQEKVWSKPSFEQFVQQYASRIDKKNRYQYCLCALIRGHEHIPGGIVVSKKNSRQMWKPLKDNKVYEIEPCSIFTCTSGAYCISKACCYDGAFGLIEAGLNGHWYMTSHVEA